MVVAQATKLVICVNLTEEELKVRWQCIQINAIIFLRMNLEKKLLTCGVNLIEEYYYYSKMAVSVTSKCYFSSANKSGGYVANFPSAGGPG